jgi:hypothetical protein
VQLPINPAPQPRIEPPPEILVPEPPKPAPPPVTLPPKEEESQPQPRRASPKPVQQTAPAVPAPTGPVAPPAPPPPPVPVPELTPLLSAEQQRAYESAINDLLARAQRNIGLARSRNLNAQQKDQLARAEAFMAEARKARITDPAAAKSLAERAELLSREVAQQ